MATSTIKMTNSSGTNFLKMDIGVMLIWGVATISAGTDRVNISYTQFADAPALFLTPQGSTAPRANTIATYYATIVNNNGNVSADTKVNWLAIGRWK